MSAMNTKKRLLTTCFLLVLTMYQYNEGVALAFSPLRISNEQQLKGLNTPVRFGDYATLHSKFDTKINHSYAKKSNTLHAKASDENDVVNQSQDILTRTYQGISVLYLIQIFLSLRKSGLTSIWIHVIGGPFMAFGITALLANANSSSLDDEYLQRSDTFKRLNGLMALYSLLSLWVVSFAPEQIKNNLFAKIYCLAAFGSLFASSKGYISSLKKSHIDFFSETKRLIYDAAHLSFSSLPFKQIPIGAFISLWTIAIKKLLLICGIFKVVTSPLEPSRLLGREVSKLAKITILGGSMVTAISIRETDAKCHNYFFSPLSKMIGFVFMTMAGKHVFNSNVYITFPPCNEHLSLSFS